ncbi:hypothetical protein MKX01_012155 [Papaver californicum]|nr:hypothetical protein MKX01_012155 [Papaver californicum]
MNSTRKVEVSNISLRATEQDIKEFFSFSGDIEYVEMKRYDELSQVAYVTFKDTQGAETALLLSFEDINRLVAFCQAWVKLVDDWLVENYVTRRNGTSSVGPTPSRRGWCNKKPLEISETAAEPCDDNSKEFTWWRGGKILRLGF